MKVNLFLLFILISNIALAQTNNNAYKILVKYDLPKSPNINSFERYTSVTGNYQTGQVSPKVPILSFTTDDISIPIALNYNNTGLKVLDVASWVGLGWDLKVGGAVTRTVKGLPDDSPTGLLTPTTAMNLDRLVRGQMNGLEKWNYFKKITQQLADVEHDIFNYSAPGIQGSFYINKDGKCIQLPRSNNKIEFTKDGFNRLNAFTITDLHGNQFLFAQKEESTVQSMADAVNGNTQSYYSALRGSAWHLTEIKTRNQEKIFFEYNHYKYSKIEKSETHTIYSIGPAGTVQCNDSGGPLQPDFRRTYITTSIDVYQLSKVTWKNGYIRFVPGGVRTDLKQIDPNSDVPNLSGISFYQTPTPFSPTNAKLLQSVSFSFSQTPRLLLKKIEFNDSQNITVNKYSFTYINESALNWPSYDPYSKSYNAQDYWGYFNGKINNYELIPYDAISDYPTLDGTSQSAPAIGINRTAYVGRNNRVPDPNYSTYGMLQEMTYPTGGRTKFFYEGNIVQKSSVSTNTSESLVLLNTLNQSTDSQNTPLVTMGGIRVKRLEFYSEAGSPVTATVTNISYNQSSINNKFLPFFITYIKRQTYPNPIYPSDCDFCGNLYTFTLHSSSVASNPAPIIEYNMVTEYKGESKDAGQTVHQYSAAPFGQGLYYQSPYPDPYYLGWRKGEASTSSQLPNGHNIFVSASVNSQNDPFISLPNERLDNFDYDFKVNVIRNDGCSTINGFFSPNFDPSNDTDAETKTNEIYRWTKVEITTENYVPLQTSETMYVNNIPQVPKTINYSYNLTQKNLLLPNSTATVSSKGSTVKLMKTYPQDYFTDAVGTTTDQTVNGLVNLINNNLLDIPVEEVNIISKEGVEYVVSASLSTFLPDHPVVSKTYKMLLDVPVPLSNFTKSFINNSGSFIFDSRYQVYNQIYFYNLANKPLEFSEVNGPKQALLWDQTSLNIIAHAKNASYKNIFYQNFEESEGNSVRDDAHTGHMSKTDGYSHSLTGLDNGNYTLSYWTKIGSKWVLQTNAVIVTNSAFSINIGNSTNIDDVCFYPSSAQISTYTYEPLIGVTSMTDAGGHTVYYEYDSSNRLMNIKDQNGRMQRHIDYHYQYQQ